MDYGNEWRYDNKMNLFKDIEANGSALYNKFNQTCNLDFFTQKTQML